jgi:predicted phage terminase large subunit-like protein
MSEVEDASPVVDRPGAKAQVAAPRAIETAKSQFEALVMFARVDFWCFVELMFPVLYPGQKLVYAPYLEVIATVLMRVAERVYRNVIINLPPRHMKSALTSILYPAWRLGCDPTVKFICISYGDDLAHDLSAQTRKIMRSELYRQIFPETILDKSAVDHIRTTMGGHRYATAVGSDITGFGADEIIIDDPVQPEDALSERVKQQVRDWVDSSVRTRFNDPSTGALVLVMHRIATDDLAGTLEPEADRVLKLPLIGEKYEGYSYLDRTIMERESGEPLNPSRMSIDECEALRSKIPARVFNSQYQQRPTDDGSCFCSIDRLARYDDAPPFEATIHSWDIAMTKDGGDYTVCAKFGLAQDPDGQDILYLTGVVRMQIEMPDVRESMMSLDALEKPAVIVFDGNGIGKGVHQDLWRNGFRHLLPGDLMERSNSENLKVQRFCTGLFHLYAGRVRIPNAMPGLEALLREIAAFPEGKYDDQVDALSYVAAYRDVVTREARRWGLRLGRLKPPPRPQVQVPPPKSRDQELYDRRRQYRD